MRKRDTRARVEGSFGLGLSKLGMPLLWLALAPTMACAAHEPAHAPCGTVYGLQDGGNSRCATSRPDGIYPIGYGSHDDDGPPSPPPRSEMFTSRPETTAREIKTAIEGCEREKLWNAILGYEQFSSLVKAPLAQETYAQMIKECLAMHLQDLCDELPKETPPRLGDPKIQKVVGVQAGGDWKSPFTLVTFELFDQGQTPPKPRPPITLVQFSGDWWILPKMSGR